VQALVLLGQNPETLTCVYCDKEAETWDHLVNLVRDGQLHGYGHQVGNLVPCCRHCNSKKGSKEWQEYLRELTTEAGFKDKCSKIQAYCGAYAVLADLERMKKEYPNDWEKYCKIKQQIFSLMREADEIAIKLKC
jgi:RNA polymerase subunit RPABC4/transcription elongation factor Spt4